MSISATTANQSYLASLSATASLSQVTSADDPFSSGPDTDGTDDSATAASNSLTGSATGSLSSQTLQSLMDLLQNDDSSTAPPAASGASGTQTADTSQAKPHHHHHGGGGAPPASSSSTTSTTASTTADPSIFEADEAQSEDPLLSALMGG